ncbi:hypothetical protein TRFO_15927 [Tritrichomonas foetus]|uniref:Uncharacterized protein n=1 Tax=Tritrichomonas foetus TaxID=1144522 RepID=A0A1J4KVN8_9EUKA|nr:hypothetical protein TRFO_15927 [Tritrichomonas foetus]|eukprot:OHT13812.1 hypothetical protein TRFO_15927 [Tritrichomonas foetus]
MIKPLKISVSADNITEILGYYHHELSQHTSDLNTLKQHVHNILQRNQINTSASDGMDIFLDNSNKRFESFAASIKSISKQIVLLETTYKRDIELSVTKITEYIDNCVKKLNERIDDLSDSYQKEKEKEIEFSLNNGSPKQNQSPQKPRSSLKKGSKKKKPNSHGQRERLNCVSSISQSNHNDSNNSPGGPLNHSHLPQSFPSGNGNATNNNSNNTHSNVNSIFDTAKLMNEISILKNSLNDYRKNSTNEKEEIKEILLKANREMFDEFNNVYIKLDDFVTKNDLDAFLADRKPSISPYQTPRLQTPRRTVHVTLINGDSLRGRPPQQQKSSAYNYGKSRTYR